MLAYRCATCDIQYPTRRALTNHLRQQQDKGEPHAACNDDSGHHFSSATNTNSAKQTRYPVLPNSSFVTSKQPAVSGGDGGISGLCSSHVVGRADSPDALEVGNGKTLSNNFKPPGAIGCPSPTKLFHSTV